MTLSGIQRESEYIMQYQQTDRGPIRSFPAIGLPGFLIVYDLNNSRPTANASFNFKAIFKRLLSDSDQNVSHSLTTLVIVLATLQIVGRLQCLICGINIALELCSSAACSASRCYLASFCSFVNVWRSVVARRSRPPKTVNDQQQKTVQSPCAWRQLTSRKHYSTEENGGKSWRSCCDRLGCCRQPAIGRSSTMDWQMPESILYTE